MQTNCPQCFAPIKTGAKFCAQCGASLAPPKPTRCPNPSCGAPLDGNEVFCGSCGHKIEQAIPINPVRRVCTECAHFRVATPISILLRAPGKNAMEAITKISEDETQTRDAEAKQKVELIKISRREWGMRPAMTSHCAAHMDQNIFEIHELKNRNEDCSDFRAKTPQAASACFSCKWREPHGDPYARLNGITDNKIHSSMMEGINAEIGLEVTSIYHAKGSYPKVPLVHDWCKHFSHEGYIAIPYSNRYNDCLAYRSRLETIIQEGIIIDPAPPPAASHESIAEIMSEIVAAMRTAYQGNPQALAGAIIRHLKMLRDSSLRELFENFVIFMININLSLDANNPVFTQAAQPVFDTLSARARQIMQNPPAPEFIRSLGDNPFSAQGDYLPLGNPSAIPAAMLPELCVQTVCEAYWLDRLGTPARRQFLNEERVRLRHGMYPQEAVAHIERVVEDLEHLQSKLEDELKGQPQENDFWSACLLVTPLSNLKVVQLIGEQCAMLGCTNVFTAQPLDKSQRQLITDLMSGVFNLEDAVRFLADRHKSLLTVIQTFWAVGDRGDVPFDLSPYFKLMEPLIMVDMAHHFVTVMLNRHSRRLRGAQHVDYPHAPRSIMNLRIKEYFKKSDPSLEKALFPARHSLRTLSDMAAAELPRTTSQAPQHSRQPHLKR